MPCYDYWCWKCETSVEVTHKMSDTDYKFCHVCSTALTKQITKPSPAQFVGGGRFSASVDVKPKRNPVE